ncbi:MAG: ABC transporter ATP-binding protein [Chloroflexia bacterium]|nr:ABC transporter ATP-binding protein [Chloroflexia bacterium]
MICEGSGLSGKRKLFRPNVLGRLLSYLRPYWRQVLIAYVSMILATLLSLFIPQVVKTAIDRGLAAGQARSLFIAAGTILGLALLRGVGAFGQRYFGEWLTHRFAYDLRNHFYQSVQRLPFEFHDRTETGDIMSRATSDISEAERFVGIGLMQLLTTVIMLVGVTVAMLLENWSLSLLALIPLPLLLVATIHFGRTVRPMFKGIQEQMGVLSSLMQQSLTGMILVKAFAREPYELGKFDRENEGWFDLRYRLFRVWANNWPLYTFILMVMVFMLLWLGGQRALVGEVSVGSLFVLVAYVLMLNGPMQRLGFLVNLAATAAASATRVFEIIDTPNPVREQSGARELQEVQGRVSFRDVHFAYPGGSNILQGVDFEAQPGQRVALIGPTGSGKTTVINLIPRFYDVTEGQVLVDGVDVRDVTLSSLRRQIGIVLQDTFLFRATIAENIAYGRPDASMDGIVAAAQVARAHDFIRSFPQGYETRIGERGVTVSGGQKQRIAIARALLYDPRILILDDATSSVDTETEHLIQQALEALMEGRTTFIIAQRLLSLKAADVILVLDEGRIVQQGTHEALVAQEGLYRQIYDLQLREQEEFRSLVRGIEVGVGA